MAERERERETERERDTARNSYRKTPSECTNIEVNRYDPIEEELVTIYPPPPHPHL